MTKYRMIPQEIEAEQLTLGHIPKGVEVYTKWWIPSQGGTVRSFQRYKAGWEDIYMYDYVIYDDRGHIKETMNPYRFESSFEKVENE